MLGPYLGDSTISEVPLYKTIYCASCANHTAQVQHQMYIRDMICTVCMQ